jgi:hypothetical protein
VEQVLVELQRRVAELERSPHSVPSDLQAQIESVRARVQAAQGVATAPPAVRAPAYVRPFPEAARPPAYSSSDIDVDSPFDGRARRRRVIVRFVLLIVIVFGALLGAMGYSYLPQARIILTH